MSRHELHCDECNIKLNLLKESKSSDTYELDRYGNYVHIDNDMYYELFLVCPICGRKEEIKDGDSYCIQSVEVVRLFAKNHNDYTYDNGTQLDNKLLGELMNDVKK